MPSDETKKSGQPGGKTGPLTDEELAGLLGADLDSEERAALLERLHGDPVAAEALALAAGPVPDEPEGLSDELVDQILGIVRESRAAVGLCPHCAGDLHPDGDFCPHCGARVLGSPLACLKCGKPVREGSAYCPHCGSVFRPLGRKGFLEGPLFLLLIGFLSIVIAVVYKPLFVLFLAIGCVSLGAWAGEVWVQWRRLRKVAEQAEEETEEVEGEEGRRRMG